MITAPIMKELTDERDEDINHYGASMYTTLKKIQKIKEKETYLCSLKK